ncbi:MAG: hypothetical protein KW802_01600 [Candidatus Doudnabacteria bacterium]|nr:hypothetical protein [Candidatus Doudnabacteria bacterium]
MPAPSLGFNLISIIFYLLMVVFVLYSLLAIYSLLRFGRTKIMGIIMALLYLIICAALYASAVGNLNLLKI